MAACVGPLESLRMSVRTVHGELGCLDVCFSMTVGELKERIYQTFQEKIPPYAQRIIIRGQIINDDTQVLKKLGIEKGDKIWVVISTDIQVKIKKGRALLGNIVMRQAETVGELKSKIFKRLPQNIPPQSQVLFCNRRRFLDDKTKIRELGLQDGEEIALRTRVQVKNLLDKFR